MINIILKEWLARIGNADQLVWEIGKQITQKVSTRQMLKAFVRVRDLILQRNGLKKKLLRLFYFPNPNLAVPVNSLLIKYGHATCFPFILPIRKLTIKTENQK